jgi:hypothetical protein
MEFISKCLRCDHADYLLSLVESIHYYVDNVALLQWCIGLDVDAMTLIRSSSVLDSQWS